MKGKFFSFSFASVLLLTAVGSVCAQTTPPVVDCPPLTLNRRMQPTTPFRYTVNYAVSASDPSGSVGIPGTETAVQIINRHSSQKMGCVYVLFKDKDGVVQGVAQGSIPPNGSKVFATSANVSNSGTPPPFMVDYSASAVDTSSATQVVGSGDSMPVPFEGRAEIYSKNPKLQVAPFVMQSGGGMSVVPVQRAATATGNN
jgi:hypothetical protein